VAQACSLRVRGTFLFRVSTETLLFMQLAAASRHNSQTTCLRYGSAGILPAGFGLTQLAGETPALPVRVARLHCYSAGQAAVQTTFAFSLGPFPFSLQRMLGDPQSNPKLDPSATVAHPSHAGRGFVLATIVLALCFSRPLYDLIRFAVGSGLYSHILLIPLVSVYLIWIARPAWPDPSAPARRLALGLGAAGLGLLALYGFAGSAHFRLGQEDRLAFTTLSFLLCFAGICCGFLGRNTLRTVAFPLGFLLCMVPFPAFLLEGIVSFLQSASASAAHALFQLAGTPVYRNGMEFRLPGMSLEVAPECSGIRSTLVLFITSLLAGYLFLRSPVRRAALAAIVIPLAIFRNGLRIFTIGQLCVHISPDMIHSPIHRRGGPVFFVLSLIPFFLVLYFLRRSEAKTKPARPG
jgi:exosortase C (VPDSG-CTERM-specific)